MVGCRQHVPFRHQGVYTFFDSADVNGDGRADLIASADNRRVRVYLGSVHGLVSIDRGARLGLLRGDSSRARGIG
jgi:hypothetical protein